MTFACTALNVRTRRCEAYGDRPMVCRIWGMVEELACPWGCRPEGGFIDSVQGLRLMNLSLWYGGSSHGMEPELWERRMSRPGVRELVLKSYASRPVVEDSKFLQATIRVRPAD